jgi:N-acetyltransferase 10
LKVNIKRCAYLSKIPILNLFNLEMSKEEADRSFNSYDIKRFEMYAQNLVDYHLVIDLVPEMAKLYFTNKLGGDFSLSLVQAVRLLNDFIK